MARYTYVVLTNPTDGNEDAFNDWYDNVHLADVLAIPGFVGARRFRLAPELIDTAEVKWRYLAIYDIETDDLPASLAELVARAGTQAMTMSDALDVGGAHAMAYLAMDGG